MRSLIQLLLALAVVLLGIADGVADAGQVINRQTFHCLRGPLALRIGTSLSALRRLGNLRSEVVEPLDPYGAEPRVLHFDGLRINAVFPRKNYEKGLIEHVRITSADWSIAAGIRVGLSVRELSGVLKAGIDAGAHSVSVCGEGDCVVYSLRQDRVAEINYQCYTG